MTAQEAGGNASLTGVFSRAILWLLFVAAALGTITLLILTSIPVVGSAIAGRPPLQIIASQIIQPGSNGGATEISTSGGYNSAVLVFSHLSSGVISLATSAALAEILTQAALGALIALLAWRLLHRRPFRRSLSAVTIVGGGVLLIGGAITQILGLITGGVAAAEVNLSPVPGFWPFTGKFDPSFIGIGIVLILAGLAFRYGASLQRDTEGLV